MSLHFEDNVTLLDLCKNSFNTANYESEQPAIEQYWLGNELDLRQRNVSYKDLKVFVDEVSKVISEHTGEFQVIGVHLEPSIELVVAILSILSVKKAFAPFKSSPTPQALQYAMSVSNMRYILSSHTAKDSILRCLKEFQCNVTILAEIDCVCGDEKLVLLDVNLDKYEGGLTLTDLAYVVRTSGTTGTPKVIAVSNRCIVPNITHLSILFNIQSSSKVALMSPPTFDPSIVEMFMALHKHATLVIPSTSIKMQPPILGDVLMNKAKVTVLQATPSIMRRFTTNFLRNHFFCNSSSLKVMAFGGEACPSYVTIQSWLNRQNVERRELPNMFFNVYGISEVSSWASCQMLDSEKILGCSDFPVPLGIPLLNTKFQIHNKLTGAILYQIDGKYNIADSNLSFTTICVEKRKTVVYDQSETQGKLYVGGEHRCCHVIGCEITEYHDSGDIVEMKIIENEHVIDFIGRADATVKRNGKKINLRVLAEMLSEFSDVKSCHVMAFQSNQNQLEIVAFLLRDSDHPVVREKSHIISSMDSKTWTFNVFKKLLSCLDPSQIPDRLFELSCLPITHHGKIDEGFLKQLVSERHVSEVYDIEFADLKEAVTSILTSILQGHAPGLNSLEKHQCSLELDFSKTVIDMGADSFTIVALINWLEAFLNIEISKMLPDAYEIMITTSLGDVIEKLSSYPKDLNVDKSKISRKRKCDFVATAGIKSLAVGFPLSISRGDCVFRPVREHKRHRDSFTINDTNDNPTTFISEVWKCDTGKCIDASPLVYLVGEDDGFVYIGSHSHLFQCVTLHGEIEWSVELPDRIESSACLCSVDGEEFVAVGCYDHNVYTVTARTGKIYWRYRTGAEVKSSPCWSKELKLLCVGSHDGFMYALDVKEKKCLWKTHCGGGAVYSSPSILKIQDEYLTFGATLQGRVICLCGQTGEGKWSHFVGKPVFSSLCVNESGVYFGCVDAHIYCLNRNGELVWKFRVEGSIFSSPSISCCGNGVLIGSHDGYLYKICRTTGSLVWKTLLSVDKSAVFSTPFSIEGFAICASTSGIVCVADNISGRLVSHSKLPGEVFSSPVAFTRYNETNSKRRVIVHVGCRDDNLYCLEVSLT